MAYNSSLILPSISFPSRSSQLSAPLATELWEQVLSHRLVSSKVADHHIASWRNGLEQDGRYDPFAYWIQYSHREPDGKECADAILCALQEMLDGHQNAAEQSYRTLFYMLFKYAKECGTVPSTLFISGPKFDDTQRPAQGGFADVYRGSLENKPVAMKTLRFSRNMRLSKALYREALFWRQMKHPRIISFIGLAELDQPYPSVYMVSPWMDGGSLGSRLRTETDIDLSQKASWIWQVCDGLQYLHKMGIIHGDLRGANVLLDAEMQAAITDFGLTQLMDAGDNTMSMSNRTGTIRWMAPEVLASEDCTYKSDTYSFGCTSLEILTQTHPFPELTTEREVRRRVPGGQISVQWPDTSSQIPPFDRIGPVIRPCFDRDPQGRPSMESVANQLKVILVPENDSDEGGLLPLSEDPDPMDAAAFEKNIRRFILLKLHLEMFFPPGDTFVDSLSKAAGKLRQQNPGSTLGNPENLKRLVTLSLYQPVIYCDDSGSMRDRRYNSQRELVQRIARIATAIVPNNYGVELRFINDKFASNLRADEVDDAVARVKPEPQKLSDLGNGLRAKILKPLVYDVLDNPRKRLQRPLLVCIITDGHPYPENESIFKNSIVECRQRLVAAGHPPTTVMFVVNQIGSEQKALEFLGKLREDPEIRDVLYCTTSRIDKELEELRDNERRLAEWLLRMLSTPIMSRLEDDISLEFEPVHAAPVCVQMLEEDDDYRFPSPVHAAPVCVQMLGERGHGERSEVEQDDDYPGGPSSAPLPPPRPPLLDDTDSDLEKDDYSPPSNAPPSNSPLPRLHEDPDPIDAVAFEKNIRRFILRKLHLEMFFPLGDTFVDSLSKAAGKLRQENPGSALGYPENLKRLVPLSLYQPVIYCDDSGSMRDRRYNSQRELVQRIARIATAIVPNNYGVELRFINDKFASNLRADEVDEAVARVKPEPQKLSDLGNGLRAKILKPLVYDVLDNPRKRLQRPLLVCVITDGHPYPENESIFKNSIVECRQRLVSAGYPPTAVMFVVNQIGSEQKALEFLGKLREDPEIRDVLYCTTSRIDKELEELRDNEQRLAEWLLRMLTEPIMLGLDDDLPRNGMAQELAEAQEELEELEELEIVEHLKPGE